MRHSTHPPRGLKWPPGDEKGMLGEVLSNWARVLALLASALVISSCARYAAQSNRIYPEEPDGTAKGILDFGRKQRLQSAMQQVALEHQASRTPGAAPNGMRWSDVPNAVYYAVSEVEMAIVKQTQRDWGWEYELLTIEDYPGTLQIRRTNDARVYEAVAVIGRVIDQPGRAEALLKELRKQMLAFGRKRSLSRE